MNDIEEGVSDILGEYFPAGVPHAHVVEAALPVAAHLEKLLASSPEREVESPDTP